MDIGLAISALLFTYGEIRLGTNWINSRLSHPVPRRVVPDQLAQYGTYINQVYGKTTIPGNIIWARGLDLATGAYYFGVTATFALGLCRGPVDRVFAIWSNGELIWHGALYGEGNTELTIDGHYVIILFHNGSEDQPIDPVISSYEDPDEPIIENRKTPAFRGLAYLTFYGLPTINKMIPNIEVGVVSTSGNTIYIATVLNNICNQVGISNVELDLTDIGVAHIITGYSITQRMSARQALEPLLEICFAGIVESTSA